MNGRAAADGLVEADGGDVVAADDASVPCRRVVRSVPGLHWEESGCRSELRPELLAEVEAVAAAAAVAVGVAAVELRFLRE